MELADSLSTKDSYKRVPATLLSEVPAKTAMIAKHQDGRLVPMLSHGFGLNDAALEALRPVFIQRLSKAS